MSQRVVCRLFCLVAVLGLVLVAGCSNSDPSKNAVNNVLNPTSTSHMVSAKVQNGLSLGADPEKIVIDPDNPSTPTDPNHGNQRYGEASLLAIATDSSGAPQADLDLTFGAAAGVLASGGAVVKTDAQGRATDKLRVYESDPESIEVTVTDGTRVTTIVVTKIVAAPPVANAGPDQVVECTGNSSAKVRLDGSGSSDPNGDITVYEWFERFGTAEQALLGTGQVADVVLPLGVHVITLRVTDATGKVSTDVVEIRVVDTMPPRVNLTMTPSTLWPANHRLVDVHADVLVDECGPYTVRLVSVTSNEPDNGLGDGDTPGDIQGVSAGTADYDFELRAERAGGGGGRVYTVVYEVVDAMGLVTIAEARVVVPHDQSGH
jgi:hypothetical protein